MSDLKNTTLWRISNHHDLSGEGGLRASGRWHTRGHRIVYLAASPPGAELEMVVQWAVSERDLPLSYTIMQITFPENVPMEVLRSPTDEDWRSNLQLTRAIGDEWLCSGRTALAEAPSAIMPHTSNYLLNPDHLDAENFQIAEITEAFHDPRLLKRFSL